MKSSTLARRQLRNHARYRGRNDLTIVPMLDVMVILTFFLIFTAVFSKTSIVEVHLPGPGAKAAAQVPTLELEVIVRRSGLEVADRNTGVLDQCPGDRVRAGRRAAVGLPRGPEGAVSRQARMPRCWSPRTWTTTPSCR